MLNPFIIDLLPAKLDSLVSAYERNYGMKTPIAFLECAEKQLRADFLLKTGIRSSNKVCVSCPGPAWGLGIVKGEISSVIQGLIVIEDSQMVRVAWKSKSGRIYDISDGDIDCSDIEIWFENIDVAFVHKYLYPNSHLPFKLKNLSYQLEVVRLIMDCEISLFLDPGTESEWKDVMIKVDNYLDQFNRDSEKKDRKYGLVHHWSRTFQPPSIIKYQLDMGSAGMFFFKDFLNFLSALDLFEKVIVE